MRESRFHPKDLFVTHGAVGRGVYAIAGIVGFAIKHNLDRWIASEFFGKRWEPLNYLTAFQKTSSINSLQKNEFNLFLTLLAIAIPFIWIGTNLTRKRLRSANRSAWWTLLFFVPFVNLALFLALCLIPQANENTQKPPASTVPPPLHKMLPSGRWGSAAVAIALTALLGAGLAWLCGGILRNYSTGLFVGLPFFLGMSSSAIFGVREQRTLGQCVGVSIVATTLLGLLLLAFAIEGLVCILMAAPLAYPLAAFGGAVGFLVQQGFWDPKKQRESWGLILFLMPGVFAAEKSADLRGSLFEQTSSIEIDAPPEKVWEKVVSFSTLPEPEEWIFRIGIAYPTHATLDGRGVGALRHCHFSTGEFEEPIEIWDEPRLLRFGVTKVPAPMQEWTPYPSIDPPHLHGFFASERGQFLLTPLANGGTRIDGTTWYRHGLWPESYWMLWSDEMIHQIHMRVLRHIKKLSEAQ